MFAMRIAGVALALLALATAAQAAGSGYRVLDKIAGPDGRWDYVRVDTAHNRVLLTHGGSVMAIDLASKAVSSFDQGAILHDAMPVNGGAEVLVTHGGTAQA